jgi:hypothetical protein
MPALLPLGPKFAAATELSCFPVSSRYGFELHLQLALPWLLLSIGSRQV